MEKILFQNATIVTSSQVITGDLLCENGVIANIGQSLPVQDARAINAQGRYLLPGGVDPHTHFDLDVGFTRTSDNFYTGGVAAAWGGTTTVIDHMAFGPAGCALSHQAEVYHTLAKECVIDYGFHGVIQHVDDAVLADMATLMQEEGITSFKAYMTYDFSVNDKDFLRVLERAKELGAVICVHCENDAIINRLRQKFVQAGHTQPRYHPLSRPDYTEAEAVTRALALARAADDADICIVHLTSRTALEHALLARSKGQQNIYLETCPQYLYLDDTLYDDDRQGLKYIMSPPLRKPADSAALWQAVEEEAISTIGTDHCPFFFETQKQRGVEDFTQCPNGAPGVELRMPLLFSHFIQQPQPDFTKLVRLCCTNPARLFGVAPQKGDIAIGADADLALINPQPRWTVTKSQLHENVDYTPYEGQAIQGRIDMTLSRGEVLLENGVFRGEKGRGQYLKRKAPSL